MIFGCRFDPGDAVEPLDCLVAAQLGPYPALPVLSSRAQTWKSLLTSYPPSKVKVLESEEVVYKRWGVGRNAAEARANGIHPPQ